MFTPAWIREGMAFSVPSVADFAINSKNGGKIRTVEMTTFNGLDPFQDQIKQKENLEKSLKKTISPLNMSGMGHL